MSLGDITVNLNLDGKDFEIAIKKADISVKKFTHTVQETENPLKQANSLVNKFGESLEDYPEILSNVARASVKYFGIFVKETIRANAELERLQVIMTGLQEEQGAEGVNKAADSIRYLRDMAKNAPFDISALQDSFIKFKTAGIDPTNGSVQALVDSVAKFGGNSEQLKRASIAIQQMAGKGVVSMEELRQQLGEAVPDAMKMMADGMHLSMAELTKIVSTGTLEAESAINAMLNEMERTSSGSAQKMMETWGGLTSRLKTVIDELLREVGQTGLFENLKKQLSDLIAYLESDRMNQIARDVGDLMNNLVDGIRFVIDNAEKLVPVIKIVGAQLLWAFGSKAIKDALPSFNKSLKETHTAISKGLSGSIGKFNQQLTAGGDALRKYQSTVEKHNRILRGSVELFGTMYLEQYKAARAQAIYNARVELGKAALAGFGNMAKMAGRAMSMMLGPAGAILMLLYEIAQAFDVFGDKVDELREKASKGYAQMETEEFNKLRASISDARKEIVDYKEDLKGLNLDFAPDRVKRELVTKNIAELQKEVREGNTAIRNAIAQFTVTAASEVNSSVRIQVEAQRASINAEYQKNRQLINEWKKKADEDASLDKEETKKEFDKRIRELQAHQSEQILNSTKQIIKTETNASRERIRADAKMSEVEKNARIRGIDDIETTLIAKAESDAVERTARQKKIDEAAASALKVDKTSDIILNKYKSILVKVAGVKADIQGESQELAKALQQVANEDIKHASKEDLAAISVRYLALQNELKIKKELAQIEKKIQGLQAKQETGLKGLLKGKENPYLKLSGDAKQLQIALQKAKDTQDRWRESGEATNAQMQQQSANIKTINDLLTTQSQIDQAASILGLERKTQSINKQLMSTAELRALRETATNEELSQLDELGQGLNEVSLATGISVDQLKKYIDDYRAALKQKLVNDNMTATDKMFKQWSEFGTNMENVMASAISGVADQLTNLAMTGKADFADLANSITQMITKITIQYAIMKTMTGMGLDFSSSAGGNVVGPNGVMSLKKYADGGIAKAHNPQVAVFGEGDQNEAFVPLPDGRRIPVDLRGSKTPPSVEVNVINQSGQQVTGESQGQRFDGEKFVLDIVLKAVNRPGNFRSSMKGALGNG